MCYFLCLLPIILIFYNIQNIIPTYAYLNTNELNTLNLIDYYFIKIQRSFCVDNIFDLILYILKEFLDHSLVCLWVYYLFFLCLYLLCFQIIKK